MHNHIIGSGALSALARTHTHPQRYSSHQGTRYRHPKKAQKKNNSKHVVGGQMCRNGWHAHCSSCAHLLYIYSISSFLPSTDIYTLHVASDGFVCFYMCVQRCAILSVRKGNYEECTASPCVYDWHRVPTICPIRSWWRSRTRARHIQLRSSYRPRHRRRRKTMRGGHKSAAIGAKIRAKKNRRLCVHIYKNHILNKVIPAQWWERSNARCAQKPLIALMCGGGAARMFQLLIRLYIGLVMYSFLLIIPNLLS